MGLEPATGFVFLHGICFINFSHEIFGKKILNTNFVSHNWELESTGTRECFLITFAVITGSIFLLGEIQTSLLLVMGKNDEYK